jgi:hypothetical protein
MYNKDSFNNFTLRGAIQESLVNIRNGDIQSSEIFSQESMILLLEKNNIRTLLFNNVLLEHSNKRKNEESLFLPLSDDFLHEIEKETPCLYNDIQTFKESMISTIDNLELDNFLKEIINDSQEIRKEKITQILKESIDLGPMFFYRVIESLGNKNFIKIISETKKDKILKAKDYIFALQLDHDIYMEALKIFQNINADNKNLQKDTWSTFFKKNTSYSEDESIDMYGASLPKPLPLIQKFTEQIQEYHTTNNFDPFTTFPILHEAFQIISQKVYGENIHDILTINGGFNAQYLTNVIASLFSNHMRMAHNLNNLATQENLWYEQGKESFLEEEVAKAKKFIEQSNYLKNRFILNSYPSEKKEWNIQKLLRLNCLDENINMLQLKQHLEKKNIKVQTFSLKQREGFSSISLESSLQDFITEVEIFEANNLSWIIKKLLPEENRNDEKYVKEYFKQSVLEHEYFRLYIHATNRSDYLLDFMKSLEETLFLLFVHAL